MPIIDVSLSQGILSTQKKNELAQSLTQCLLNCDVSRDNPRAHGINWCYIHEIPEGEVFVGGEPEKKSHYRIEITLMQGAMSEQIKQQIVTDMTQVVLSLEGQQINPLNAARVWIIFHEITDGNWAAGGRIYRLQDLMGYLASK